MATWIDCACWDARTLSFLIDTLGENNMVFGSDYCCGLGPLSKALAAIDKQPNPEHVKSFHGEKLANAAAPLAVS